MLCPSCMVKVSNIKDPQVLQRLVDHKVQVVNQVGVDVSVDKKKVLYARNGNLLIPLCRACYQTVLVNNQKKRQGK